MFFASPVFFFYIADACLFYILIVHLGHWLINLGMEWYKTRSCGVEERHEGYFGWFMLFVSAVLFTTPLVLQLIWPTNKDDEHWTYYTVIHWDIDGPNAWFATLAWCGAFFCILICIGFTYVHYHLGLSWSGTVTLKQEHKLITTGPYRWARHPMYAVIIPFPLALFLVTGDWFFFIGAQLSIIYPVSRCRKEERLMQKQFGDEYREYMDSVGPFFPFPVLSGCWGNKVYPATINDL